MTTKQQCANAFAAGKKASCYNATTDGQQYKLHSTVIAEKIPGGIRLNWGGWYQSTTASHMNAVLKAVGASTCVSYAQARDAGIATLEVQL